MATQECPCGYYADPFHECSCTPSRINRYLSKLSGPLLDRIDLQVEMPAVRWRELNDERTGEDSKTIRQRVKRAHDIQKERFVRSKNVHSNAQMQHRHFKKHCELERNSKHLLQTAMEKMGLSARAINRILKVSRTIADLAGEEKIQASHISEAIQYRSLDRRRFFQ